MVTQLQFSEKSNLNFRAKMFYEYNDFQQKQKIILKYFLEIIHEHKILGCRSVLHTEW